MTRRLFIGIDLPSDVKKILFQKIKKWQDLPIKWSSEENLHLTLCFLGYVSDELLKKICESVKLATENTRVFDVNFRKIELGPKTGKEANMVWVTAEANEGLLKLKENTEKELGIFQQKTKAFRPHITLGRIIRSRWKEIKNPPEIFEEFNFSIPVEEAVIFESIAVSGKRKFIPMESCPLK